MQKIKSIKWSVELSYRDTFVFQSITQAANFMADAVRAAENPEDVISYRLVPYIEYEEETEIIYCDTDSISEADKNAIKEIMNEKFGVATSIKDEQ